MYHSFIFPVLLSIISIVFTAYATLIVNRKISYINTVTSERVKWIGKVRENISTFCGITFHLVLTPINESQKEELLRKIDILRTEIKLQLNPDGEDDKIIIELVDKIPTLTNKPTTDELKQAIREITEVSQHLLKTEWEKVKQESKRVYY